MKRWCRAFRVEIVWVLLLLALAFVVPRALYGGDDDELCYMGETFPPCENSPCGCNDYVPGQ